MPAVEPSTASLADLVEQIPMSALLLKTDIARYFPVAIGNVDPKMPPERLAAEITPDFAAKPSLPSVAQDRAGEAGRYSAINRAHPDDRPLPRGQWAESRCAGSLLPTHLCLLKCEMQGDSVKMQREQRPIPAESGSISMRWNPFPRTLRAGRTQLANTEDKVFGSHRRLIFERPKE